MRNHAKPCDINMSCANKCCCVGVAGERLTDVDVDTILKLTGTEEDLDGNIKYEGSPLIFRLCDPLLDLAPMHTHDTRYY